MTLAMAWVRRIDATEELVVASDSRLRWGRSWDCCPKIVLLPRTDCVICFAGSTLYAYPLMLQMINAIGLYPASMNRGMGIEDLKGHTLKVFERMRLEIHDLPRPDGEEAPDTLFLLAGFSWREHKFKIWKLLYDPAIDSFTYQPHRRWNAAGDKLIALVGDEVKEAKRRLVVLLRARGRLLQGGFNMEPLEVLRDMIRDNHSDLIGGPPQLVKLYRYMQVKPFGLYWPDRKSGVRTVMGRPLLQFEKPNCQILDPDTLDRLREPGGFTNASSEIEADPRAAGTD